MGRQNNWHKGGNLVLPFIHILSQDGSICLYLQYKGVQDGSYWLQNTPCNK